MLQDHGSGHWAVGVSHQVFQQEEFFWPEIDRLPQARGSSADQIQFEVSGAKHIHLAGGGDIGSGLA